MLATIIITLFLGIILGLLLATCSLLWLIKVKCPKCKQLRPVKEIIFFNWKKWMITEQLCQQCQRPKPQIDIS